MYYQESNQNTSEKQHFMRFLQLAAGAVIAAPQNRSVSVETLISSHRPNGMHVHYGATGDLLCRPCGPWFPCSSVRRLAGACCCSLCKRLSGAHRRKRRSIAELAFVCTHGGIDGAGPSAQLQRLLGNADKLFNIPDDTRRHSGMSSPCSFPWRR